MAHPAYLREKARQLRRDKRLTIDELAERLALPRTTIYYWVRDLSIPRPSPAELESRARLAAARSNVKRFRVRREQAYAEGLAMFLGLARHPTFRDFVAMYIGEGYKRCRNTVSLANSDPAVICLANTWISRLARNKLTYCFQFHSDQDVDDLRRFWGRLLDVEPGDISFQRKSNSSQLASRTWRCRYGVLTVRSSDTYLRARLQAWMDCVRSSWLDSQAGGV
jgi:AcrR family transcriptional regulator